MVEHLKLLYVDFSASAVLRVGGEHEETGSNDCAARLDRSRFRDRRRVLGALESRKAAAGLAPAQRCVPSVETQTRVRN